MLSMQAFHKWLLSTASRPGDYQGHLARLTRVSRTQLLNVTSDLTWNIWEASRAAGS